MQLIRSLLPILQRIIQSSFHAITFLLGNNRRKDTLFLGNIQTFSTFFFGEYIFLPHTHLNALTIIQQIRYNRIRIPLSVLSVLFH
jgi:hypothetical protein